MSIIRVSKTTNHLSILDRTEFFAVPFDILTSDLSSHEKIVYMVLQSFVNPHDNEVEFPTIDTIASLASISRSTVLRVLNRLENKGYILRGGTNS